MNNIAIIPGAALTPLFEQWSKFILGSVHGSAWRNGAGAPESSLGQDGDYYLDISTGNVYFRLDGVYSIAANIKGPAGPGSVGLSMPNTFTVTNSPLTGNGTINVSYANESANTVLAGPTAGSPVAPSFRSIVSADLSNVLDPSTPVVATDASTITFNLTQGSKQIVTLGGNRILALSGTPLQGTFTLILKQDAVGGRSVTWFSGISWANGVVPQLTATANKRDVFTFINLGSSSYIGMIAAQNC